MDPREQLLQSLLDELKGFQLPERYDEAKKAQIMKGRKSQAEIDKGREEIRQNELAYQAAQEQRKAIQDRIPALQAEIETSKQRGVDTAGTQAANERKAAYDAEAGSARGIATQIGATVGAPLAGIGAGRAAGLGINALMDASQTRKNEALAAAAQNRVAGLTTREGARIGAERAGVMPAATTTGRVLGRVAPHAVLGASVAGKGALLLNQGKEDDPFYSDMANRAAGLGMIGAGSGIAERGVAYGVAPGVPPDANAISVIESNQLRRNNNPDPPETPPPAGPKAGTVPALRAEAKAAGVTGAYKMNKTQLNAALASIKQVTSRLPVLAAPLVAGALAASMTPNRAEAADGTGGGQDPGKMATNAAVAGTTAAGTAYGINRLARAVPAIGRVVGPAGNALAAYGYAHDAQKYREGMSPELRDTAQGGALAGVMPLAMRAASDIESWRTAPSRLANAVSRELTTRDVPPSETEVAQPGFLGPDQIPAGAPPPQNALGAAGQQKDPFGTALDDFMAFVQQEMADQQQGAQQ